MKTIDEAIAHAREVAKEKRNEHFTFGIEKCKQCADEHEQLAEWLEELKEYKDAEEKGLLLRLPCKVGDKVWCLTSANTKIVECKVLWIEIHTNGVLVFSLDGGLGDVVLAHLNKIWFLTKAEAEQALEQLKEREGTLWSR